MPAITPDSTTGEEQTGAFLNTAGHSTAGLKHVTLPFLSANAIDGADTYTPGSGTGIARAAWEGTTSGDECAITITDAVFATGAEAFVTFNASTDNIEGYLHLWISG
jgi:hypothetical protein